MKGNIYVSGFQSTPERKCTNKVVGPAKIVLALWGLP